MIPRLNGSYCVLSIQGEIELAYDEEWEIDESQLSIKEEPLGEGAFGLVMKAEAYDLPGYPKCHTVAVKMLKSMSLWRQCSFLLAIF